MSNETYRAVAEYRPEFLPNSTIPNDGMTFPLFHRRIQSTPLSEQRAMVVINRWSAKFLNPRWEFRLERSEETGETVDTFHSMCESVLL